MSGQNAQDDVIVQGTYVGSTPLHEGL